LVEHQVVLAAFGALGIKELVLVREGIDDGVELAGVDAGHEGVQLVIVRVKAVRNALH
jgi:hypothetical protein